MQTRPWGESERQVPVLGQGTWNMERDDRQACIRALREGLDLGLTHVDTAELYGRGRVEELVAEAIAGRRDEVFLVSKVLPQNASRVGTKRALEQSLARLQTDHLDSYLLHWPGRHPLEDTLASFVELREEGKILSFGVSNFDEGELEEAVALAGAGQIACNQVLYHLRERTIEHAVLPACVRHGVTLVAYSPFGSGDFPAGHPALLEVAERHGKSERQVALAFLTRHEGTLAIPKAARVEHVRDNAGAADLRLGPADLAQLDAAFPLGRRRRGVASL